MIRLMQLAFGFALILLVTSCGLPREIRVDEMQAPDLGLIYGQVRLPDPDWDLNLIMIQRVGKTYFGVGLQSLGEEIQITSDGRYVVPNLKPGKYMLSGIIIGRNRNLLGKAALNYTVEVKPGGVHYMGVYDYKIVDGGDVFRYGTFELEADRSKATKAKLLVWVEEATRGTRWHGGVQKMLGGKPGGK